MMFFRRPLPIDQTPQQPPVRVDGRCGLLTTHHLGYVSGLRHRRPEGKNGSPTANISDTRCKWLGALRGVRICHLQPQAVARGFSSNPGGGGGRASVRRGGNPTRAVAEDVLDWGLDDHILSGSMSCPHNWHIRPPDPSDSQASDLEQLLSVFVCVSESES